MAAKGTEAKDILAKKLGEIFGNNFLGVHDKKMYVNIAESSGDVVQLALAATCPKTPIEGGVTQDTSEITKEDEQKVEDLLQELGL